MMPAKKPTRAELKQLEAEQLVTIQQMVATKTDLNEAVHRHIEACRRFAEKDAALKVARCLLEHEGV